MSTVNDVDRKRFWLNVAVDPKPQACWNWTGPIKNDGYGYMYLQTNDRKQILAHRFSRMIQGTTLTPANKVLHHCDNQICVRPNHLYIGTDQDNATDRSKRFRGNKHSKELILQVKEATKTEASNTIIGHKFHINRGLVSLIRHNKYKGIL